jgi:S-methylmethionine-dependent homocysteine/selenocysteine methylase
MNQELMNRLYLTDGGLETTLIFLEGIELPHFAAFELINNSEGRNTLRRYFEPYISLAKKYDLGFILGTPTWRANPDWGYLLGYSLSELDEINRQSVIFLQNIRDEHNTVDMLVSGCVGPRGDGYVAANVMSRDEAAVYHFPQMQSFVDAGVDLVSAMTLNYIEEAIGITIAARSLNVPLVISFTVETDGRLADGVLLSKAIETVDAVTNNYVSYYMINCAHPDHFKDELRGDGKWLRRIGGVRPNASVKSHAELDESTTLDRGDVKQLVEGCNRVMSQLPELKVIGGCCGTDHDHIDAICGSVLSRSTYL